MFELINVLQILLLYGKAMYEDLTSESCTLLYVLISSLLTFRRVNIRYLELNIPQVCNVFLIFYGIGVTRLYLHNLRESIVCDVLNRCASFIHVSTLFLVPPG